MPPESIPEENDVLLFFRRFLAIKIGTPFVFQYGFAGSTPLLLLSLGVAGAVVMGSLRKHYWPGILLVFLLSCYQVWQSWPFTLNHTVLETVILCLLVLDTRRGIGYLRMTTADMIKYLMLSVWIYSGFQKLIHGYYLNGEYLALETLSGAGHLGMNFNTALRGFERIVGSSGFAPLTCCSTGAITIPTWEVRLFQILGWLTVLTELFLPVTVLFARTRKAGILGLFLFQATIALLSDEIDFAFTATAVLLLFLPRFAKVGYPLLSFAFLVWMLWL